ncbi:MAG TPA: hypothetical protein VFB39_17455, partial [Solirubrobacteraceae bacterium]|nr:hypothetical protein [Solirubrobacteraceae bacterium]
TPSTSPSPPAVHVPGTVPTVPGVSNAKHLVHTVTSPARKVVKELPVPKLPVPGGLGLPSNSPSGLPGQALHGLTNKALGGL